MKRPILTALVLAFLGLSLALVHRAHAEPSVTVVSVTPTDAGIDAPPADAGPAQPSDSLHNPVDEPAAAIDDARQAIKQGWAIGALAIVVLLVAGLSRAASKWPTVPGLSLFATHKTVLLVVTAIGAVATAAYNSLALGGSWYATLAAAGGAALVFIAPKPAA